MTYTTTKEETSTKKHELACKAIQSEISNIELKLFDWEKIRGYAKADTIINCLKKDLENLQTSLLLLKNNES